MVWNGRFLPASAFGDAVSRENSPPRSCKANPSHPQHGYVRSKVVVVALDDGENIPFVIDDREVSNSIAGAKRPGSDRAIRFAWVNE